MITMVSKIPPKYERIVLEEYYKFYQFINGEKDIFYKSLHFTTDKNKLTDKELKNISFMDALKTITNENNNMLFLLTFEVDGKLTSVARIKLTKETIHICDIVYPSYSDDEEKEIILGEIIHKIEEIASVNNQNIDFEIPFDDDLALTFVSVNGFVNLSEDKRIFQTMLLTKIVKEREKDECTLSRKQGKKSN